MEQRGYMPHIKGRREEATPSIKARRWVLERTHSWMNRSLKLLVSFEKSELSYTVLLSLSAALICCRQTISIYG
jgi:putative transposase